MKELKSLNKRTAPKSVMPEKIIQFGEGNFLRAFVDWIVWNMNKKTDFNGSVVVVQPLAAIEEKLMMLPFPASTIGFRNTCVGITVPVRFRFSTV